MNALEMIYVTEMNQQSAFYEQKGTQLTLNFHFFAPIQELLFSIHKKGGPFTTMHSQTTNHASIKIVKILSIRLNIFQKYTAYYLKSLFNLMQIPNTWHESFETALSPFWHTPLPTLLPHSMVQSGPARHQQPHCYPSYLNTA